MKKEKIELCLVAFLIERNGKQFAYHILEKEFPLYCLNHYNITCNAQTFERKLRLLVARQPIILNREDRLALFIEEIESQRREKYWKAEVRKYDNDLFGIPT